MNVKNRALILISLVILLVCGFLFREGISHYNEAIDHAIKEQERLIDSITNDIRKYSFDSYHNRINRFVRRSEDVRQAFAARDRERLYEICAPVMAELQAENEFFHAFVFSLPDGSVFLRVQTPEYFGDNLSELRPIVAAVHKERKQFSGFDVCPHGTIFWVAEPVFHEGEYIGAVEFGIEARQLEESLAESLNSNVTILLKANVWHKAELVEEGFHRRGDYVLMTRGKEVFNRLALMLDFNGMEDQEVVIDGKAHVLHSCALLPDFRNETLGRMLILQDISDQVEKKKAFIVHSLFLTLFVLVISIGILYYSFGILVGRMEEYARENRAARESLQKAHDKLEERVRERTVDLAKSNARLEDEVMIRRRAEIRVENQRKFLETIIESMTNPFYVIDVETFEVIMANRAACDLSGQKTFAGMTCYLMTHHESSPCAGGEHPCPLAEVKKTGKPVTVEHLHFDRDGNKRHVEIHSYPVFGEEGKIIQLVEHCLDITERKQSEREREKLLSQLYASQKMEAVGILAGGVAHDFNNILSTILGYSQIMALKMEEDNPMRKMTEEIYDAAERATVLTRQLLAFSRRQVMQMKVVSLNAVIDNISGMIGRLIGENIEMRLQTTASRGNVRVDVGQMEQVIMNLVVNARDAMPDGGTLTIATVAVTLDEQYAAQHHGVEPGPYTVLTIADTGIGMSREVREKIFEPFFTTKKGDQATGLGLATVYGIVRQHNGHIHVYSERGRGTTFKIYLPCVEDSAEDITKLKEIRGMPPGNEAIMVVDDDATIRRMIRDTLEPLGYTIIEADCSESALAIMEKTGERVDLIVTDLIMPGMNGRELIDAVRREQPHIRSILMSGYTDNMIDRHGVAEPGVIFINKPLLPVALANRVREVLDMDNGREH